MIGSPPQDGCRAGQGVDVQRRRLLRLAGTAAAMGLPRFGMAAEADATDHLVASMIGDSGALPRLAYRKPPSLPVIRRALGAPVRLHLKNELNEATGLDWHGLRGSNGSELSPGLVGTPVMPGAETTIEFKPADSGTLWFHPPFVPGWSDQTARGLGGLLIVEETGPSPADDDVPLLVTDRLDAVGGGLSDRLCVNGGSGPDIRTFPPGSRLRLRLVNGSTRLALLARIEGAQPMIIAIDGQPSELFRPIGSTFPIGPGSQFDVLIDLPRTTGSTVRLMLRGLDAADAPIFVARADGVPTPERPPIVALSPNPALPRFIPLEKATRADIVVRAAGGETPKAAPAFTINGSGHILLPKAPLFVARRNAAVTLGLTNNTAVLIGFRLHGHAMRLLHSLDDGWEPYWRHSILVPPGKTLHAAFVADTPGRWLIESPFFDQATTGLRHWFEIT